MGIFFNKKKEPEKMSYKEYRDTYLQFLKEIYNENMFEKALSRNSDYNKYKNELNKIKDRWWGGKEAKGAITPRNSIKALIDILESVEDGDIGEINDKVYNARILGGNNLFHDEGNYPSMYIRVAVINNIESYVKGDSDELSEAFYNMMKDLKNECEKLESKYPSLSMDVEDEEDYCEVFALMSKDRKYR